MPAGSRHWVGHDLNPKETSGSDLCTSLAYHDYRSGEVEEEEGKEEEGMGMVMGMGMKGPRPSMIPT